MTTPAPTPSTLGPFENGLMQIGTSQSVHLIDAAAPDWPLRALCHAGQARRTRATDPGVTEATCARCLAAVKREKRNHLA